MGLFIPVTNWTPIDWLGGGTDSPFLIQHQLWAVAGSAFMVVCTVLILSLPMPKLLQNTVRKEWASAFLVSIASNCFNRTCADVGLTALCGIHTV